jgi:ribonuclease PH
MTRIDGRQKEQLRPVEIIRDYIIYPEGSVLISLGGTKVLCNASIEESVPPWLRDDPEERGWVTAEYSMLPRSTLERNRREVFGLKGRTQEIKRLIGRSLRQAVDLRQLGQRTIIIDCDVLQADGGTRTAAVTGGYVALRIALKKLIADGEISAAAVKSKVAALSVGIINGEILLDLCYAEDSSAEMDTNIVMNSELKLIEIQGTAESVPFSRSQLDQALELAEKGIQRLFEYQDQILSK